MELNLATLARYFSDEVAAWELVEKMRWPVGPVCPNCGEAVMRGPTRYTNADTSVLRYGEVGHGRTSGAHK